MPRLVVAEKPSVARDLARVLGVKQRKDGFLEGNGWVITWCIGHLAELCEPHEYSPSWKRWNLGTLPMIPEEFQLRPNKRTRKQFNIVKRLLKRRDVTSVVNACDAGREGELIFRYVYQLAGATKPIERLWISSMTDEAITQGFNSLRPGHEYDRLWHAARGRSEADWLVGLNATRAMTLRVRQALGNGMDAPLMSVGRVQTPTLAMIVHREQHILNFEPQDYWQLVALFHKEESEPNAEPEHRSPGTELSVAQSRVAGRSEPIQYQGKWFREVEDSAEKSGKKKVNRFTKEAEALEMLERLQGLPAKVGRVQRRTVREKPPFLFDLSRLQRTANKRYGYAAAKTLELAQSLYEKHKLLTYPRTDSNHLSTDMIGDMPNVIQSIAVEPYTPFVEMLLALPQLPTPRRVFNNKKVSDHHAIIPTPRRPNVSRLSRDEQNIYDLVVRRFLAAFFPDAVIEKTTVITTIGGEDFLSQGKVIVDRAWREVLGLPDQPRAKKKRSPSSGGSEAEEDEPQGFLPPLQQGEDVVVEKLDLQQKQTKPPPRYNEASLLAAMEGAGKTLDEDELKQALKDSGLGTPATRASTIETLLSRNYMERRKKTLYPTPKGMQLIELIPVDNLKSAELTGQWEAQLSRIARGEEEAEEFYRNVRAYVFELIQTLKQASLGNVDNLAETATSRGGSSRGKRGRARTRPTSSSSRSNTTTKNKRQTRATKSTNKTKTTQTSRRKSTPSRSTGREQASSMGREQASSMGREQASSMGREQASSMGREQASSMGREQASRQQTLQASASPQRTPLGACPVCQQGQIIWGRQAWGCNRWKEGCMTVIPYVLEGRTLQRQEVMELLQRGQSGPLAGFQNKQGSLYAGTLRMQCSPERNIVVVEEV